MTVSDDLQITGPNYFKIFAIFVEDPMKKPIQKILFLSMNENDRISDRLPNKHS